MKVVRLPAIFAVSFILTGAAAHCQMLPLPTTGDFPRWTFEPPQVYTDKQLYGAIDGGAEEYFEYGFLEAAFMNMKTDSCAAMLEVYHMRTPEAAFGIFSVSHTLCNQHLLQGRWSCVGNANLSFACGEFFVRINGTVNCEGPNELEAIAVTMLRRIRQPDFETREIPPALMNAEAQISLRCIMGPLALQNNKAEWVDTFEGMKFFTLYSFPSTIGKTPLDANIIIFASEGDRAAFLKRRGIQSAPADDAWRCVPLGATAAAYSCVAERKLLWLEANAPEHVLCGAVKNMK
jgi:hypothetical protein